MSNCIGLGPALGYNSAMKALQRNGDPSTVAQRAARFLLWVASMLMGTLLLLAPAAALTNDQLFSQAKRVALVVGNSDYRALPGLQNAATDARAIAATLERLNFKVHLLEDAGLDEFKSAVETIKAEARGAEAVLVYYSGHGFQLDGVNYLVPTDAVLESRAVIDQRTMRLDSIVEGLASPDYTTLILLDACRDNPLPPSIRGASSDGLAQPTSRMANTYIAFSTQPGNVSFDGAGGHSPFASALLDNLEAPGETVSDIMIKVRAEVLARTSDLQEPWELVSLREKFYFNPAMASPFAAPPAVASANPLRVPPPSIDVSVPLPQAAPPAETVEVGLALPGTMTEPQILSAPASPAAAPQAASTSSPQAASTSSPQAAPAPDGQPVTTVADLKPTDSSAIRGLDTLGTDEVKVASLDPAYQLQPSLPQSVVGIDVTEAALTVEDEADDSLFDTPLELKMALQEQLQRLGCYDSSVDGKWGRGSQRALEAFFDAKNDKGPAEATEAVYERLLAEPPGTVCVQVANLPEPVKQTPKATQGKANGEARPAARPRDNPPANANNGKPKASEPKVVREVKNDPPPTAKPGGKSLGNVRMLGF